MTGWKARLPSDRQARSKPHHQMFWRWVDERQRIWHRRFVEHTRPPWTKDPILAAGKFCNVYRELDRETRWVFREIMYQYALGERDQWFAALVFRLFNRGETFDEYAGFPSATKTWVTVELPRGLRLMRKRDINPFTSAYIVNSGREGTRDAFYLKAVRYVFDQLDWLIETITSAPNPETQHDTLMQIPGVGPFVAYQIWQDLSYLGLISYTTDQFVVSGPGSRLGLRLLYPAWQRKGLTAENCIWALRRDQKRALPRDFPYWKGREISVANIQNCLCEYAKYWKMKIGEGKQRQRFTPISTPELYTRRGT